MPALTLTYIVFRNVENFQKKRFCEGKYRNIQYKNEKLKFFNMEFSK